MQKEFFPDGTLIDSWFYETAEPDLSALGKRYKLTDYGIFDDGRLYTNEIQSLIDTVSKSGGGVIYVPPGTYMTGALFFKPGVSLYVERGGTLKGSDDPSDYPTRETRIEGETCMYLPALINADGCDGFTMCGGGTIDGNGLRAWKAFWLRRAWNPDCTNKDEQRPRLVYISNSSDVTIAGLSLQNAHYWTTHIYKCRRVKYLNCRIYSPYEPVKAPSTDAIDIDACTDVLVKGCCMHVNDDSVVLKGGKGPWADTAPENGITERVIVEDCTYGFCHGCLTCGSEAIHCRNIIVRRVRAKSVLNFLWLKMRPDTPQLYEYITIEDAEVTYAESFINIAPWTQFYDLKDRKDIPLSYAEHITVRSCRAGCGTYFDVVPCPDQYRLKDFTLENLDITAAAKGGSYDSVEGIKVSNVNVRVIT